MKANTRDKVDDKVVFQRTFYVGEPQNDLRKEKKDLDHAKNLFS